MKFKTFLLCFFPIMLCITASAWSQTDMEMIPPSLEPWKGWVLHGHEDRFCPKAYNTGEVFACAWPSRLKLSLEKDGGHFNQQWMVFKKGWVPLPGCAETWPRDVRVNGKKQPVIERGGSPSVFLQEGSYDVEGSFAWKQLPVTLCVPPASGLVSLTLNNKKEEAPLLDKEGRLWLQKRKQLNFQEGKIEVKVYRLMDDDIPMRITSDFRVNVSGGARNIKLETPVLDGFIPMIIQSPLPARLSDDGRLVVQARPGRWDIRVTGRSTGPVHRIAFENAPYDQEIWAFRSQNHLRMIKVSGVPSIDPDQTDLPHDWKSLPAFMVKQGDVVLLDEIRRGDPDPAPDRLSMVRTWWLDFDGRGYTINDRINGTMSRQWYLAMNPPCVLGRVSVDDRDQLITSHGIDEKPGVELRKGRLDMKADSRIPRSSGTLPAVGWDHDLQSLSGSINLPPGWLLVSASGVDAMPGTWLERWTLLDLFIVLIIALAVFRLWDWKWGLIALIALSIIYHEQGAPRLVWLHLLATSALLRFLPAGWFMKFVRLWRLGAAVTLLALALPFIVQQVRWGVYPQLEPVADTTRQLTLGGITFNDKKEMAAQMAPTAGAKGAPARGKFYALSKQVQSEGYAQERVPSALIQDPNALIQTGPGLPTWKWRSYSMKWNGPVNRNQEVRLWLLPPSINLALCLARVLLLAMLIFGLLRMRQWRMPKGNFTFISFVFLFLALPGFALGETKDSSYPSPQLLEQLRERLLEKPDCLPRCADSPQMAVNVTPDSLRILFSVHSDMDAAIPLPGLSDHWRSGEIFLDGAPAQGLARDREGLLWMLVPKGIHQVLLVGTSPEEDEFQINLPLKPHNVVIHTDGWDSQGIDRDGHVKDSIKLVRKRKELPGQPSERTLTSIPAFLDIKRVFSLGLDWSIQTTVTRLTDSGAPVVIPVPLIAGESVTTEGIRVEKGEALVQMAPNTNSVTWESTLEQRDSIELKAPESVPWTETWILDASPIWHCELSGIPVVHHQDKSGHWKPRWQPWPGESVTMEISRPKAVPGQVKTIDQARLSFTPGDRFSKGSLSLQLRSSQGGQHSITLPAEARLQSLKINGKGQPVKSKEQKVVVPLKPGSQTIDLEWHQDTVSSYLTRTPRVDLGQEGVNAEVTFQMPVNRWIIMAMGPRLGPAVLFWSYLGAILLAALGLGRISWTPLRTRHWILLGLGLTQIHPLLAIMIVGWLLALGLRKMYPTSGGRFSFDFKQVVLGAWTLAAMVGLYTAIQKGLLGIPSMQISGNGSHNFWLHWTQDRVGGIMPEPWVLSLPMMVFRILMLAWALWLAYSLLKWLKWGWQCFSEGGLWRKIFLKKKQEEGETGTPARTPADKG